MEIKLTEKESEDFFHNALCNGAGWVAGYGITMDYSDEDYAKAKKTLKESKGEDAIICREEVWMQILKNGGKLIFNSQDVDTSIVELKHVHERVQKTPLRHLMDMVNERDDAITADCIIQTVLYEEVIFG